MALKNKKNVFENSDFEQKLHKNMEFTAREQYKILRENIEFTIPADALMDWANIEFMFWSEGDINSPGNYILVDNIKIVDVADETRTNLDTIGRGDFEGYLSYVVLKEEDKIIAKLA